MWKEKTESINYEFSKGSDRCSYRYFEWKIVFWFEHDKFKLAAANSCFIWRHGTTSRSTKVDNFNLKLFRTRFMIVTFMIRNNVWMDIVCFWSKSHNKSFCSLHNTLLNNYNENIYSNNISESNIFMPLNCKFFFKRWLPSTDR